MLKEFIHISPIFNRDSISKFGILPSEISLQHHAWNFIEEGVIENEDDPLTYAWVSCDKDDKFVQDMVYCKVWIDPRNRYMHDKPDSFEMDIDHKTNLYGYDKMIFDVYLIKNFKEAKPDYNPCHWQEPCGNEGGTLFNMDPEYAHDDKLLGFSREASKDITIIKQACFEHTKCGMNIKVE